MINLYLQLVHFKKIGVRFLETRNGNLKEAQFIKKRKSFLNYDNKGTD